jgi:hypothetical protein
VEGYSSNIICQKFSKIDLWDFHSQEILLVGHFCISNIKDKDLEYTSSPI